MKDKQQVALEMAQAGVATLSELSRLAGVSRQGVRFWCLKAGIDAAKARTKWLQKEWNRRSRQ